MEKMDIIAQPFRECKSARVYEAKLATTAGVSKE